MSEVLLRYYGDNYDEDDHSRIVELLKKVHREHGIKLQVERVNPRYGPIESFPGRVREADLQEVYERDFERNRDLSSNVGRPPSDAFKTNSGNIVISGTVGIVDSGLRWAAELRSYKEDPGGSDPNKWAVNFLENVAENGVEVVKDQYGEGVGTSERAVINQFLSSDVLGGDVRRGVDVGPSLLELGDIGARAERMIENASAREIDIVIETDDLSWVIEAKKEYSAGKFDTALGQALVSARLYGEANELSDGEVQPAILLGTPPSVNFGFRQVSIFEYLVSLADDLGVRIFVPEEGGGFRLVES